MVGKTCDVAVEFVKDIDVGGVVGGREGSIEARRPANETASWMSTPELWLPVKPVALLLVVSPCEVGASADGVIVGGRSLGRARGLGLECSGGAGSAIRLSESGTFAGVGSPLSGQKNGNMLLRPNTTAALSPIKLWSEGSGRL